jgi:hypothetical protein
MNKLRQQYHFREVGEDTYIWDVNKLLKTIDDSRVVNMSLDSFKEQYFSEYWSKGKSLSCSDIATHARLINEADLSYPILVCPDRLVVDGMHRLCKAFLESKETIKVIVLDKLPEADYININPEDLHY